MWIYEQSGLGVSPRPDIALVLSLLRFSGDVSALGAKYTTGVVLNYAGADIAGVLLFLVSLVEQLVWFYVLWGLKGIAIAGCLYEPCFAFLIHNLRTKAKRVITMIILVADFASTIGFISIVIVSRLHLARSQSCLSQT